MSATAIVSQVPVPAAAAAQVVDQLKFVEDETTDCTDQQLKLLTRRVFEFLNDSATLGGDEPISSEFVEASALNDRAVATGSERDFKKLVNFLGYQRKVWRFGENPDPYWEGDDDCRVLFADAIDFKFNVWRRSVKLYFIAARLANKHEHKRPLVAALKGFLQIVLDDADLYEEAFKISSVLMHKFRTELTEPDQYDFLCLVARSGVKVWKTGKAEVRALVRPFVEAFLILANGLVSRCFPDVGRFAASLLLWFKVVDQPDSIVNSRAMIRYLEPLACLEWLDNGKVGQHDSEWPELLTAVARCIFAGVVPASHNVAWSLCERAAVHGDETAQRLLANRNDSLVVEPTQKKRRLAENINDEN
jgi:hypothetical protein